MTIPSSTDIVAAALAIVQAACPSVKETYGYAPAMIQQAQAIFLFHDGYADVEKTYGGIVRRTHHIPIWLVVNASNLSGMVTEETTFLTLNDQLANAFYTNRTLGGIVADSTLTPQSGPAYIEYQGAIMRNRVFLLESWHDLTFHYA